VIAASKKLCDLARLVGGKIIGDDQLEIFKVGAIEEAGPGEITFLAHPRYRRYLEGCRASAIIVGPGVVSEKCAKSGQGFLEASNPYLAFAKVLQLFTPPAIHSGQVSPAASIDSTASLEAGVTVFPNVFVGREVKIGRGTVLYPGVFLGDGVEVGAQCILHPNVTVRDGCRLGNKVVLHAGVVIGSDGFGYAGEGQARIKIPQIGIVFIEDDVEIGANTTVDRATMGRTMIRRGAKIDNLVQIAHNVVVGEDAIIAAQAGIAGSTQIGKDVIVAGQVGIVNHVKIGDGARIGPQSGIPHSVPAGALLSGGVAAAPHHEWLKVMTLLPQLPKLWNSVRTLEKKVSRLVSGGGKEVKRHGRR
jgi:UDP-3-O-[3-hydroxymyristoyl] glucosamine N-acyltransferase